MHNNSALQCKHDCVCINIILLQLSMSQGCFKDDQAFFGALLILEKYERLKCLKNISQSQCTTIIRYQSSILYYQLLNSIIFVVVY